MDRRKSWEISLVHVAAHTNIEDNDRFRPEKVSPAFPALDRMEPPPAWLKNREINALKSP
jgi:hypothetical protein